MHIGRIYRGNECVIPHTFRTEDAYERMRGLLGRPPLLPQQALLISPCSSIHTFGMPYALDIVFVSKSDKVVKIKKGMPALRMSWSLNAKHTIELLAGEVDRLNIKVGDILEWRAAA